MNPSFHHQSNTDQGDTSVTHHAKASSAGPGRAAGSRLGRIFRGVFVTRAASGAAKGSGAPSPRRAKLALLAAAALALAVAFGVASAFAGQIHQFGSAFGSAGSEGGQLSSNKGIAVDNESGAVYVADTGNHRVEKFDSVGNFVLAFGKEVDKTEVEKREEQETNLEPVTVTEEDENVCTLASGDTCQAGTPGSAPGELTTPSFVAVDNAISSSSHHDVYVADTGDGLLSKFGPSGALVSSWGTSGQLDGSTATDGPFGEITGIAVDTAGDLYVANSARFLFEFTQSGTFLSDLETRGSSAASGIAVDTAGFLYKIRLSGNLSKHEPDGETLINPFDSEATGVAVDTSNDEVYVAHAGTVSRWSSADSSIESGIGSGDITAAAGIAVNASSHYVYVSDPGASRIEIFEALTIEPPTVSIEAPSLVNAPTETYFFAGHVTPGGTIPAYDTTWRFDCQPGCGSPGGEIPADEASHLVEAEVENLQPNTKYTVTLHAENVGGETTASRTFKTPAAPPLILLVGTNTPDPEGKGTTLRAYVNPRNSTVTDCRFEYGQTTSYGQEAPCQGDPNGPGEVEIPLGSGKFPPPVEVSAHLTGLNPGATYHFRLSATNQAGTTHGEDSIFEATERFAEPPCENEARRTEQHSSYLPDCRAYEQVSPVEKSGGEPVVDASHVSVADDGSAATFDTLTFFGDALGGGVASEYMSTRGAAGWSTHGITPPQEDMTAAQILNGEQPVYEGFSADLSRGAFFAPSPLTEDPSVAKVANLYLRNDARASGAGSYTLLSACPHCTEPLSPPPLGSIAFEGGPRFAGASADFGHLIFESQQPLVESFPGEDCSSLEDLNACPPKLYESDHGTLRLVGRVPPPGEAECDDAGGLACEPSGLGSQAGQGAGANQSRRLLTPHVISADGSRIEFTAPSDRRAVNGTLYLREGGVKTFQLNVSEREGAADVPSSAAATYWDASSDGSRIFFASEALLTDDATREGFPHLYMYDVNAPRGHHLTLISPTNGPSFQGIRTVLGVSSDGRYVYFSALGRLVAGLPINFEPIIYAWHDGVIRYVAKMGFGEESQNTNTPEWVSEPPTARVSADGQLLFSSHLPTGPTGYDQSCGGGGSECTELYLYSFATQRLSCVSCASGPAEHGAFVFTRQNFGASSITQTQNRPLTSDGRHVFFSTSEALVPSDTNGAVDAYQYDTESGTVHLLSSGTSPDPSYFMNASPDGSNALIFTRQQLTGADHDLASDLYDARQGGGFPEPPPRPAPCGEDTCQSGSSPPPPPVPATPGFNGPGNPPALRCPKGRARRHGKCVSGKSHKRHKHHRANANRRTSR